MPGEEAGLRKNWFSVRRIRFRTVILVATGLAIVSLVIFGPAGLGWWARNMARREMNVGAISAAQQWLAWAAWFDPSNGKTDLLEAGCFRRQQRQERWNGAIESAQRKGVTAAQIQQERRLGLIQAGQVSKEDSDLSVLIEAGLSPHDVCTAFVYGYLAKQDLPRAKFVLDSWMADYPNEPHVAYMRGVFSQWLGSGTGDLIEKRQYFERAEAEYRDALARQPRHELARTALAELLESQDRFQEALAEYATMAAQLPESESAMLSLARLFREVGCLERARVVLEPLTSNSATPTGAAAELGYIELESGDYDAAAMWLSQANLDQTEDSNLLRAAATAFSIQGKNDDAERLLSRLDRQHNRSVRINDLAARLSTGEADPKAADELQRLSNPSLGAMPAMEQGTVDHPATPGTELYARHCSGCHAANGDGHGRGARHVFPKPRDFRNSKFRLGSTANGFPTLEDLEMVIRQGMPGTSMPAFDKLSKDERMLLAQEVLRLHREGLREQLMHALRNDGDEINEDEVEEQVEFCTTPADLAAVPRIGPADASAIARGRDTYFSLGCNKCHGDDGTGVWDVPLYDDRGDPSEPRDLVHEPFKGGHEPESIYLRLLVGLPGTPHPSCGNVPSEQLVDLVHFCRSLSREPKRVLTNHQRAVEAARRPPLWALQR